MKTNAFIIIKIFCILRFIKEANLKKKKKGYQMVLLLLGLFLCFWLITEANKNK